MKIYYAGGERPYLLKQVKEGVKRAGDTTVPILISYFNLANEKKSVDEKVEVFNKLLSNLEDKRRKVK